jgi:hypothetical protein
MPKRRKSSREARSAEPAAGLIDAAMRALGASPGWRAVVAWPEVCGPTIAARTRALELKNGLLHVVVPTASWRHDLEFVKAELVERLRKKTQMRIDDLRFSVGPLPPLPEEPARPRPARTRTATPPSTAVIEAVEAATQSVADPALREALLALGLRVVR